MKDGDKGPVCFQFSTVRCTRPDARSRFPFCVCLEEPCCTRKGSSQPGFPAQKSRRGVSPAFEAGGKLKIESLWLFWGSEGNPGQRRDFQAEILLLFSSAGPAASTAAKVSVCARLPLAAPLTCRRRYHLTVISTTLFLEPWSTSSPSEP